MSKFGDLNDFIMYLNEQIGQPYVWGCQGTELTEKNYVKVIDRREEKESNRKIAKKFCEKLFSKGKKSLRAFDCSGLGMYYLQNLKHIFEEDLTAHWMWKSCENVSVAKKGYWVFHVSNNKATHIGYLINDHEVVHAKGRSYGVVKQEFKKGSQWNYIGKPKCFNFDETPVSPAYVFQRVLKYGCEGEDVIEMKRLLIGKGFKDGISVDKPSSKNFRSSTRRMVKQFQKFANLKEDGIAGRETIVALGGVWLGD